jgi:hypothetical protein
MGLRGGDDGDGRRAACDGSGERLPQIENGIGAGYCCR